MEDKPHRIHRIVRHGKCLDVMSPLKNRGLFEQPPVPVVGRAPMFQRLRRERITKDRDIKLFEQRSKPGHMVAMLVGDKYVIQCPRLDAGRRHPGHDLPRA